MNPGSSCCHAVAPSVQVSQPGATQAGSWYQSATSWPSPALASGPRPPTLDVAIRTEPKRKCLVVEVVDKVEPGQRALVCACARVCAVQCVAQVQLVGVVLGFLSESLRLITCCGRGPREKRRGPCWRLPLNCPPGASKSGQGSPSASGGCPPPRLPRRAPFSLQGQGLLPRPVSAGWWLEPAGEPAGAPGGRAG